MWSQPFVMKSPHRYTQTHTDQTAKQLHLHNSAASFSRCCVCKLYFFSSPSKTIYCEDQLQRITCRITFLSYDEGKSSLKKQLFLFFLFFLSFFLMPTNLLLQFFIPGNNTSSQETASSSTYVFHVVLSFIYLSPLFIQMTAFHFFNNF